MRFFWKCEIQPTYRITNTKNKLVIPILMDYNKISMLTDRLRSELFFIVCNYL